MEPQCRSLFAMWIACKMRWAETQSRSRGQNEQVAGLKGTVVQARACPECEAESDRKVRQTIGCQRLSRSQEETEEELEGGLEGRSNNMC